VVTNYRGKIGIPNLICHAGTLKGIRIIECINSADDLAMLRKNLVDFGPVFLEFTLLVCVPDD